MRRPSPGGSPKTTRWQSARKRLPKRSKQVPLPALPYQLWLAKTGRQQTLVTAAMQRGTDLEPLARRVYEEQTGLVMQPLVLEAGPYSASLDGMTLDGDLVLEIKCPFKGSGSLLWRDVSAGQVPQHYDIQIQHQLMVSGADMAHLWVFDGERGLLHSLERDEALMDGIQTAWDGFQRYLDGDTPPALSPSDTRMRSDQAWQQAAQAFAQIKAEADVIASRLDAARGVLVALAQHPKEHGCGVAVTRLWKQGNVDYKKVPSLQGVDLTPWRTKSREEVRVSVG